MGKVIILDENTANQIAAGEVIERPASVVKELIENSIDAKATSIQVEIEKGGIASICVSDNGSGIEPDDAALIFERHATSKIRSAKDLESIASLGFRGEALASIAAVAKVELFSKTAGNSDGIRVLAEGGNIIKVEQTGCAQGTTFIVKDLFYNTPARYKFLKKDSTEAAYISSAVTHLALAHPEISFKLINNKKIVLHTPGNNDLLSTIYSVYGKEIAKNVIKVNMEEEAFGLKGYVGKPEISRGTRNQQSFFLNGRYIKNSIMSAALDEAYKTRIMVKKFPFAVLHLTVPPEFVDVNVHPAKIEVRFTDEKRIFKLVYHAIQNAFLKSSFVPEFKTDDKKESKPEFNKEDKKTEEKVITTTANIEIQSDFKEKSRPYLQEAGEKKKEDITLIAGSTASYDILKPVESVDNKDVALTSSNINIYDKVKHHNKYRYEEKQFKYPEGNTHIDKLKNAKIAGQLFKTYIIMEYAEEVYFIDQHAAHERITYEQLRKRIANNKVFSQVLLLPLVIHLTQPELDYVKTQKQIFRLLGFDLDEFGQGDIIIRGVPDIFKGGFSEYDFKDLLDRMINSKNEQNSLISDETIYMMACKSAIKSNRELNESEIRNLIKELVKTKNPFTCVHGRPVIVKMTKKELERKFKRIV